MDIHFFNHIIDYTHLFFMGVSQIIGWIWVASKQVGLMSNQFCPVSQS